jgi:uncharacterized protein with PQ loop repeat
MDASLPLIAGSVSTTIFAISTLPMLLKAAHSKDLTSYSLGNIVLSNVGNAVHSIYVFSLPFGPVWVLHSFYLATTALMLIWYVRYSPGRMAPAQNYPPDGVRMVGSSDAPAPVAFLPS